MRAVRARNKHCNSKNKIMNCFLGFTLENLAYRVLHNICISQVLKHLHNI